MAVRTERRAEEAEQHGAPGVQGPRRGTVEQQPGDVPEQTRGPVAEGEGRARVRVVAGGDVIVGAVVGLAGHQRASVKRRQRGTPVRCLGFSKTRRMASALRRMS